MAQKPMLRGEVGAREFKFVKKLRRQAFEFRHVAASVDARGHVAAMCFEFPLYVPCFRPWRRHFPLPSIIILFTGVAQKDATMSVTTR